MNSPSFIFLSAVLFVVVAARSRVAFPTHEFKFPQKCDDLNLPCLYQVSWTEATDNKNLKFVWKVKLQPNQWVGLTWVREVSLIDADILVLALLPAELNNQIAQMEKQFEPKLIFGRMNSDGVIIANSKQSSDLNSMVTFDPKTGVVVVRFARPLAPLNPSGADDLTRCPFWIFLAEPGSLGVNKGSAGVVSQTENQNQKIDPKSSAMEFHMMLPQGSLFYALSHELKSGGCEKRD